MADAACGLLLSSRLAAVHFYMLHYSHITELAGMEFGTGVPEIVPSERRHCEMIGRPENESRLLRSGRNGPAAALSINVYVSR
jgi:hypothetical protein